MLRSGLDLPPAAPRSLDVQHVHKLSPPAFPNGCHIAEVEVDPETGQVLSTGKPVVPSHYKSPANGLCMELDDPCDWPDPEDDHA